MNNNQDIIDNTPEKNKRQFFNEYEREEESKRIAYHYDDACEFINIMLGGIALHKELHFTKDEFVGSSDDLSSFLHGYFGYTGNYRLLEEEMLTAIQEGFFVQDIHVSPIQDFIHQVNKYWLVNLSKNKEHLLTLSGEKYYKEFIKYLRCYLVLFKRGVFILHTTAYKKTEA